MTLLIVTNQLSPLNIKQHNIVMDKVEAAFQQVNRANFLPEELKDQADYDIPLPIGFGQTNSQPTTVRMMLEWLDLKPGHKVLDVGSGSGWTAALIANIIGTRGKVYGVERIPALVEFGRERCHALGITNIEFYQAGPVVGLPAYAPFNRILVSAAANRLPQELIKQLAKNGKMVIPVGSAVLEVSKSTKGQIKVISHDGFAFVPLIDRN